MTEQHPPDERELEHSTSQQLPANNGVSPTAKASRKDWLALGAAAEQLGRDGLDQQALLAALQNDLIRVPAAETAAPAEQAFDWSWIAVGLAATVLLGATIVGVRSQRSLPLPAGQQFAQPQVPKNNRALKQVPSPQQIVESPAPGRLNQNPSTSSWDDLDEAISTTYTALQQLANERRGVDRSLTDFDSQLKQLSEDFSGESL
jgi:hypothetical protein